MSTAAPSATGITMEHCLGCGELMYVMGQRVAFHLNDEETCEGSLLVSEEGLAQALSMANAIRRERGQPPLHHGTDQARAVRLVLRLGIDFAPNR